MVVSQEMSPLLQYYLVPQWTFKRGLSASTDQLKPQHNPVHGMVTSGGWIGTPWGKGTDGRTH